jgi:D-3-phosphoglycerate dehydrogenase / 2-oxoglutarate reductase
MKVLVVDTMHPSLVPMLQELGLEVDYSPTILLADLHKRPFDYQGLIIRSKFVVDEDFLKLAQGLRFIGRAGAGLDLIDVEACKKRNIAIFAANEGNRIAVAEHLIGMILNLFNNINQANLELKNHKFRREANRGEELFGKKVGIIGFGHNGEATARRLAAFGCEVLVFDKYKSGFGDQQITETSLDHIFKEAQILSLHLPLTRNNEGFVNASFFEKFSNPIYFCNIARGELVNQPDLLKALAAGKVLGACLDVFENEKLETLSPQQKQCFNDLVNHPKVILTPHVAGWTHQSYVRINEVLRDKIKLFLEAQ